MLLGSGDRRPRLIPEADALRKVIQQYGDIVLEDFQYAVDLNDIDADFAIVLGGDGSILRAAKKMGRKQVPVIGVNLGKLGFLADINPENLDSALQHVVSEEYRIVDHLMFKCQLFDTREDKMIAEELGLNEVAFLGGPPFSIQQIEVWVDGELATTYRCDGLILSTPVGSTAHSLSVGGPILRKNLQAFVISPISPHTLTVRPVVDTADRVFDVVVQNPHATSSVVLDGQMLTGLECYHRVRVQKADPTFKLVEVSGQSYYRTLREKLGWGGHFGSISDKT